MPKNVSSEVAGVESEPERLVTLGSGPSCPEVQPGGSSGQKHDSEGSVPGLAASWLGDLGQSSQVL